MTRNIIIVALIGLLAACSTQGDGTTTDSSDQAEPTVVASASAGASGDTSNGPAGEASAACGEAFAAMAGEEVTSLSDLADLEGVEATIQQCESVADWMAGAGELIGEEVNPATARLLLDIRCDVPSLADTAVCEDVAAS